MKRIVLRAPKDPFEVVSPEQSLEKNLIGTNAGNVVFINAAYKLLATRDTRVEVDRFRADAADAPRINDSYDAYVIPLANAFRASYEPHLIRLTRLIEKLRIPVVVLGVGAQSGVNYERDRLRPLDRSVSAFVRAVLDRGPSIGVRGEFSQSYLQALGFSEVEVIGCPSMFVNGPSLRVAKKVPALRPQSRVAINVSPYLEQMGDVVMAAHRRYPDLCYVAQDLETLGLLLWVEPPLGARPDDKVPRHPQHPLFREDKVRFFVEPWPWIEFLREFDFAFGSRIHGNIAALMAGIPAYVLAHDSRTLELARYFEIPHRPLADVPVDLDPADLYADADYTALNDGHARRWEQFAGFIARHGLRHVFLEGEDPQAFDRRMAETPLPGGVGVRDRVEASRVPLARRVRHRLRGVSRLPWVGRLRARAERLAGLRAQR